jgi:eukaryotic translation initiation factor 2-alpha kinase 4
MEGTEFSEKLPSIFARLNALVSYVQSFGVKRKVYINPLSSLNDKFFRGSILFQCVFDSKRRDIFAAGGRYDHLIQEFSPKVLSSRSQSHCVGFNLSLDRLGASMFEHLKKSNKIFLKHAEGEIGGGFWRTRRVSLFLHHIARPTNINSVMYLSLALMPLFYALLELRPSRSCGRATSAPSWPSMLRHSRS